ncbi:hypothetical protein R50345_12800 [Paenibacillus sp. FSL R5-0345]|uniref:hypothetical protein n=1 Tax=Paenibacillus sp. FSL R5-0345 TaxID=1536770 RepID=UPI0004F8AFDB|nr:hypothetical protein [Paenibacillus sp. FSL R5-0345]AIQ35412.1 hypothetical protein R50345_12800 [Paenibacillus sp. FSL R5-0345]
MYSVLVISLVLVLSVAGFLAYQNSKLVSNQKKLGTLSRNPALMYSIFDQSCTASVEDPDVIPLIQYTVFVESSGQVVVNKPLAIINLCRVSAGKGELVLADVERNVLEYIKSAAPSDSFIAHKAYLHRAANHAEKEMILNLEDVVKLQYT